MLNQEFNQVAEANSIKVASLQILVIIYGAHRALYLTSFKYSIGTAVILFSRFSQLKFITLYLVFKDEEGDTRG